MLWFKKRESERDRVEREFQYVSSKVKGCTPAGLAALEYGLNFAFQAFMARFGSIDEFSNSSAAEKLSYQRSLTTAEVGFQKSEPSMSVAFCLFKYWVSAVVEDDRELVAKFSRTLCEFGVVGLASGPM